MGIFNASEVSCLWSFFRLFVFCGQLLSCWRFASWGPEGSATGCKLVGFTWLLALTATVRGSDSHGNRQHELPEVVHQRFMLMFLKMKASRSPLSCLTLRMSRLRLSAACTWWSVPMFPSPPVWGRWKAHTISCGAVRRWSPSSAATRSSELSFTSTGARFLWWVLTPADWGVKCRVKLILSVLSSFILNNVLKSILHIRAS